MSEEYILLTLSIDSRGRVTIPAPIRTRLGLGEGDLVEVAIRPLHKKGEVNGIQRNSRESEAG